MGGTNFGFWSGASLDENSEGKLIYKPDITSYDYSAPISEAGDHNVGSDGGDLFDAIRGAIASVHGEPELQEPAPKTKTAYGKVLLQESASLFDNIQRLATCNVEVAAGDALPSMEKLMQHYGLVLYRSSGSFDAATLPFESDTLHDRVQVFVDGAEVGSAYRADCPTRNRRCRVPPSSAVGSASGRSQLTRSWTVQVSRKALSGLMGTSSVVTGRRRALSTRCTSQAPS